jgi:cytochrome c oxidase subunit 1
LSVNFDTLKKTKLMPRRIPDYADSYAGWNAISSFGSIVSVVATALFVYIVYNLFVDGKEVNSNPWQVPAFFTSFDQFKQISNYSNSLEWVVETPTPFHSYNDLPVQTESN